MKPYLKYNKVDKIDLRDRCIDISRLQKVKRSNGKIIAQCPACAEEGGDKRGSHLVIYQEGRGKFSCIKYRRDNTHNSRIWELAGNGFKRNSKPFAWPKKPKPEAIDTKPTFKCLRPLNVREMHAIQQMRGWCTFAGLELLSQRNLLFYDEVWDQNVYHPAFVITDSSRINAQARRLDGKEWVCGKTKSLKNSKSSHPIGASDIGKRQTVVLTEGVPDFCAVLGVAFLQEDDYADIAPVCITGAGNSISQEDLPCFKNKDVIIAPHVDDDGVGEQAALRWRKQLLAAGVRRVERLNFNKVATKLNVKIKDLADFMELLGPEGDLCLKAFS